MIKSTHLLYIFFVTLMLFSGCTSNHNIKHLKGYTYRGIYFGKNLSVAFKHGIRDGCETARGAYTKSHRLFNINDDYYNGWFLGRNKCRRLLRLDENGDLIL